MNSLRKKEREKTGELKNLTENFIGLLNPGCDKKKTITTKNTN